MNRIELWAKMQVILEYIGFGILGMGILVLVVIWIYLSISDRRRK